MKLATVLSGQAFIFRSLKEVLAKANELKSGDVLAMVNYPSYDPNNPYEPSDPYALKQFSKLSDSKQSKYLSRIRQCESEIPVQVPGVYRGKRNEDQLLGNGPRHRIPEAGGGKFLQPGNGSGGPEHGIQEILRLYRPLWFR